ncbi:hypothetical protein JCM5350_005042 [Sporobolomyces pararoseus]
MPPVFGGAPTCPTCQQKVYFAEQTLGPGGRAFHKVCLKCVGCGKSLEPRLLVDHDGEAYCKSCHGKSFGTKGYGAGGALVGEYQPRSSPTRPTPTSTANSPANSPVRPPAPSFVSTSSSSPSRPVVPPKPSFSSSSLHSVSNPPKRIELASDPVPREFPPTTESRPTFESQSSSTSRPLPSPQTASSAQPLESIPRSISHSTPAFSDDEDDSPSSSSTATTTSNRRPLPFPPSQFAPKSVTSSPDLCRRCGTQVYFAEQVIAVGSKWHKRCLRCASCSTTLNSHLLEKDRQPYCKKCYQENFGTGSLGITSRPTLY